MKGSSAETFLNSKNPGSNRPKEESYASRWNQLVGLTRTLSPRLVRAAEVLLMPPLFVLISVSDSVIV